MGPVGAVRPGGHESRISVRGGAAGTAVGMDELDDAATVLFRCSGALAAVAARVALVELDPDLVLTATLSPATAVRVRFALARLAGPAGVAGDTAVVAALAAAVRSTTTAYRAAEEGAAALVALAQDAAMAQLGRAAPLVAASAGAATAAGVDLGPWLDRVVYAHPGVADLGGGADGLLAGVAATLAPWALQLLATADLAQGEPRGGFGEDPGTDEAALRVLGAAASVLGMLSETRAVSVEAELEPRGGASAPGSVVGLVGDLDNLGDGERYPGRVRVTELVGPSGPAWVVEIPGTQAWAPRAGANASDLTSDVRLMAQQSSALSRGVEIALDRAQAASGHDAHADPVLLAGHSQGGIAAAALAATPAFADRHHVTHVVTIGSPVARIPVPPDIQVLSLEHRQDAVPRLEGRPNPDRRSWVTVTRDLAGDSDGVDTASGAHALREYAQTAAAADRSADPSVRAWLENADRFFVTSTGAGAAARAVIRDYRIARVPAEGG